MGRRSGSMRSAGRTWRPSPGSFAASPPERPPKRTSEWRWAARQDSLHSLVAVRKEGRRRKALVLHEVVAGLPAFRWSQSGDDWLDDAEIIDRLLDSVSPGHQYLTHDVDDALV